MRAKSGEGALAVREASDDDAAQIRREKSWRGQEQQAVRECAQGRMARNTLEHREQGQRGPREAGALHRIGAAIA